MPSLINSNLPNLMTKETKDSIKIGDMIIPFKVEESLNDGVDIELYDTNKLYVKEGVSLSNNGVLKIDYDTENDIFDLGWVKSSVVKTDSNGTPLTDEEGNIIKIEETLPGKIARWTKADAQLKTDFADLQEDFKNHVEDKDSHLDITAKEHFNTLSAILSMVELGYSDENEIEVYRVVENVYYGDTDPYKSFYINPMNDFSFNTFKIKMPQYEEGTNLGEVHVRIQRLKSSYDKEGEIIGVSIKPFNVYSTATSEGYFEWSFAMPIHIREDDNILFTFHSSKEKVEGVNDEVYMKSNTGLIGSPQCYITIDDNNTRLYNAPEFLLTNKQPNCIYFK